MSRDVDQQLQKVWAEHQRGQAKWALQQYQQVIEADPQNANAWCYAGIALHDLKYYAKSVEAYRQALQLQPAFPIAWNNLGNSLRYELKFDEAEEAFAQAIKLNPSYANAFKNRAALRATNGYLTQALQDYEEACRLQPQDAELHRNLGVILLLLGRFDEGWREYRYRWQCSEAGNAKYQSPKWNGEPLSGRTILLYAEQGLGDTIQFIRYADVLKKSGARVLVQGQASLSALLSKSPGIDRWFDDLVSVGEPYDFHCSLIDCADVLKTDATNVPACEAYLQPAPYLTRYWREYFAARGDTGFKIGIAWQGNPGHQADYFRSVALEKFRPLLELESASFYCLQQGSPTMQIVQSNLQSKIHQFPEGTDKSSGSFMDTAAIMKELDVIVTTDTSIAHLAGALGCKVWVLLNVMPDWRWLLDRADTPWYPSMRLFRQSRQGDWKTVMERVRGELKTLMASSEC